MIDHLAKINDATVGLETIEVIALSNGIRLLLARNNFNHQHIFNFAIHNSESQEWAIEGTENFRAWAEIIIAICGEFPTEPFVSSL